MRTPRRIALASLVAVLAVALTSSLALAASVHFKKRPALAFEDQGLVLHCERRADRAR